MDVVIGIVGGGGMGFMPLQKSYLGWGEGGWGGFPPPPPPRYVGISMVEVKYAE